MRAAIAYYDPPQRPAPGVRPDFTSLPARAEQVPHSAFADQSCPADAPPRASIEIRMFAFYEEPARCRT